MNKIDNINIAGVEYNIDGIISVNINQIDSMYNPTDQGVYKIVHDNKSVGILFINNIVPTTSGGPSYVTQIYMGPYKLTYTANIGYIGSFQDQALGLSDHVNILTRHYITNAGQWSAWKYNTDEVLDMLNEHDEDIANLLDSSEEYNTDIQDLYKKVDGYLDGETFVPGVAKSVELDSVMVYPDNSGKINLTGIIEDGKSAYDLWLEDGNEGKSIDEFWAFLTADKGYTKVAISYEDFNALDATTAPTNVIYVHPNSANTEYYAKVSNGNTWVELLRNNGDISNIPQIETDAKNDFSIRDEQDNAIVEFTEGHIKTKNFDSSQAVTQDKLSDKESEIREDIPDVSGFPTIVDDDADFSVKDEDGNAILKVENGHIKTKNFDSENIEVEDGVTVGDSDYADLSLEDEDGNSIVEFKRGHIKTKNFDSEHLEIKGNVNVGESDSDLSFEDENENVLMKLVGGNIITKNFDSRKLVNSKYDGDIIHPFAIYTTCNDIPNTANDGNLNRNLSQAVYLDHFINGLTEEKNIRFKEAVDKVVFTSPMEVTSSAETNRPTKFNDGVNILEANKVITINGYDIDEQSFNVLHRSTLNSVTKDVHPKVLVIGASVTHGEMATIPNDNYTQNYVYHLIAKQLFMKDKIDNGGNGFDITFLGRNERTNTFEYGGTSYTCETHHEGYRGYSLLDFLEATKISVAGFHSATTNRFSIKAYIDRFRTMDDEGNRLPWSSAGATVTGVDGKSYTIGTEINTEAKLNSIDVCTPTHVVSALGLNANATVVEFVELVNIIKTEYPTMQIGIGLCDSSGTFFPSLHPHTDDKCIVWNDTNSRHDKLFKLMDGLQKRFCNALDEANGIYLIPFFFVSPTAEGVSSRYAPLPDAELNLNENNRYYSSFGWVSSIHTNGYGHMNWGYSLYSWLKYSIAKSLE